MKILSSDEDDQERGVEVFDGVFDAGGNGGAGAVPGDADFEEVAEAGVEDAAFEICPEIPAGYTWGPRAAGIEASCIGTWGDFGNPGDRTQEVRVGAFVRFRF